MSIKNKSDVENHLSIGSNRNLFLLKPVSPPDVTSYPEDRIGRTDAGGSPPSAAAPIGTSINSDDTFAVSIIKAAKA